MAIELSLDRVLGELAAELPAHVRAFARAHLEERAPPAAPPRATAPATLDLARAAIANPATRARGWVLWRLAAPLAIENDPRVTAARAAPRSWAGLGELARARDAAAMKWLGERAVAAMHRVHGVGEPAPEAAGFLGEERSGAGSNAKAAAEAAAAAVPVAVAVRVPNPIPNPTPIPTPTPIPDPIPGWDSRDIPTNPHSPSPIPDPDLAWLALATRLAISGALEIVRGEPPRAFAIEPGARMLVVIPAFLDRPSARFAALHELGHAACALVSPAGVPRVVDEAAAARVARLVEPGSWLPAPWVSELAPVARGRRLAIARTLDAIERALPELPNELPPWLPPRALWHDPGAQAAYVAAELLADALPLTAGAFARALAAAREPIDARV